MKFFQWTAKKAKFNFQEGKLVFLLCAFCFQSLDRNNARCKNSKDKSWTALVRCRFLEQFTTSQKEKGHSALLLLLIEVSSESFASGLKTENLYFEGKRDLKDLKVHDREFRRFWKLFETFLRLSNLKNPIESI